MSVLVCPVCQGAMRETNRNGVLIDSCTQCRGVWLDRGELEKIASMVGGPEDPGATRPPQQERYRRRDDDDDDDRRYGERPRERKRSFLDLFD